MSNKNHKYADWLSKSSHFSDLEKENLFHIVCIAQNLQNSLLNMTLPKSIFFFKSFAIIPKKISVIIEKGMWHYAWLCLFLESFKYIVNSTVLIKMQSSDPKIANKKIINNNNNKNKVLLCYGFHLYLPIKPAFGGAWLLRCPPSSLFMRQCCQLSVFHNAG